MDGLNNNNNASETFKWSVMGMEWELSEKTFDFQSGSKWTFEMHYSSDHTIYPLASAGMCDSFAVDRNKEIDVWNSSRCKMKTKRYDNESKVGNCVARCAFEHYDKARFARLLSNRNSDTCTLILHTLDGTEKDVEVDLKEKCSSPSLVYCAGDRADPALVVALEGNAIIRLDPGTLEEKSRHKIAGLKSVHVANKQVVVDKEDGLFALDLATGKLGDKSVGEPNSCPIDVQVGSRSYVVTQYTDRGSQNVPNNDSRCEPSPGEAAVDEGQSAEKTKILAYDIIIPVSMQDYGVTGVCLEERDHLIFYPKLERTKPMFWVWRSDDDTVTAIDVTDLYSCLPLRKYNGDVKKNLFKSKCSIQVIGWSGGLTFFFPNKKQPTVVLFKKKEA